MIKVNVNVSEKNWKKYIKSPETYIKSKIKNIKTKKNLFKNKKVEFSLMLSGGDEIKKFNNLFRNKDKTTDVLSFPFYEKKVIKKFIKTKNNFYLGDVIINLKKVENRKLNSIDKNKLNKLWIHGFLHLIGNTHKTNKAFEKMQRLEKKLFSLIKK